MVKARVKSSLKNMKLKVDVDDVRNTLKASAQTALNQINAFSHRAQHDFNRKELLKKVDTAVTFIKSHQIMKDPRVQKMQDRLVAITDELEKKVTANAAIIIEQVKARVSGVKKKAAAKRSKTK